MLRPHRPAFTSQQMAAEVHEPGITIAKPVIVQADGKYYMCVLPASRKIDLDLLSAQIGASDAHLADEAEMSRLFPECELGAEPPFGNIFGMPTLMDKSLTQDTHLICQAGKHNQAVQLSLDDYEKLVQPRILDFSYQLH